MNNQNVNNETFLTLPPEHQAKLQAKLYSNSDANLVAQGTTGVEKSFNPNDVPLEVLKTDKAVNPDKD